MQGGIGERHIQRERTPPRQGVVCMKANFMGFIGEPRADNGGTRLTWLDDKIRTSIGRKEERLPDAPRGLRRKGHPLLPAQRSMII